LHSLDPLIRSILGPLAIIDGSVAAMVESMIRQALVARFTNYDVNRATTEFINGLSKTIPRADAVARLDDSTLLFGSHHQKILVVGNNERTVAVVGGVDWHENRLLQGKTATGVPLFDGTPYFDISVRVDGAAAEDLADLFERRWQADPARTGVPLPTRRRPKDVWPANGATVQIGPNFGCGRPFTTVPHAIRSGSELIANLFRNCETFFYAEDQYGVGNDDLEQAIKQAFANGARYGVVVLANGLTVSDIPEIEFRRYQFWSKFSQTGKNLFVFERVGDDSITGGPHAYVHSKFVLVDDRAASIASVNMNRRSWYHDSELATVITDAPELIRDLRLRVWSEHLTLKPGEDIRDPVAALNVWQSAYNRTRTILRIRPVSFATRPRRKSGDIGGPGSIVGTIVAVAAGPLLDAVALGVLRNKVDEVLDLAYELIIDPPGRMSC
jgi:phosphatidylserine/phosphatidylglycerophosphate/cardiolipin synthase-like enzyme